MVVSEHVARGRNRWAATPGPRGKGRRRAETKGQPDGGATGRHIGVKEIGGPAAGGVPERDPSHQHRGDREAGEMVEVEFKRKGDEKQYRFYEEVDRHLSRAQEELVSAGGGSLIKRAKEAVEEGR